MLGFGLSYWTLFTGYPKELIVPSVPNRALKMMNSFIRHWSCGTRLRPFFQAETKPLLCGKTHNKVFPPVMLPHSCS